MKTLGSVGVAIIGGDRESVPTTWVGYRNAERHLPCARCKRNAAPSSLDTDGWCPTCVGRYEKWKPTEVVAPMVVATPRTRTGRKSRATGKPRYRPERKDIGATDEQLAERYRAGETAAHIAADLGCDATTVASRLRGAGVEIRKRSIDADEVMRLYAAGLSARAIARAVGASHKGVQRVIVRSGGTIRGVGGRLSVDPPPLDVLKREYAAGDGISILAARHRVSRSYIDSTLKAAGVEFRPPGGMTGKNRTNAHLDGEVARLLAAGHLQQEVADQLGVSTSWVSRRVSELRKDTA